MVLTAGYSVGLSDSGVRHLQAGPAGCGGEAPGRGVRGRGPLGVPGVHLRLQQGKAQGEE